jgi:large subunit ribosomal protein L34e
VNGMSSIKSKKYKVVRVAKGNKVRVVKDKDSKPKCGLCGKELHGVPRDRKERKKVSKSKRRPKAPFGGVLCAECRRNLIFKVAAGEELSIKEKKFAKEYKIKE